MDKVVPDGASARSARGRGSRRLPARIARSPSGMHWRWRWPTTRSVAAATAPRPAGEQTRARGVLAAMTSDLFQHGVASGDPLADRVIIWTRLTTEAPQARLHWLVARDPELRHVVAAGEATAEAEHDHTVHVDVAGPGGGTEYHFCFLARGVAS